MAEARCGEVLDVKDRVYDGSWSYRCVHARGHAGSHRVEWLKAERFKEPPSR